MRRLALFLAMALVAVPNRDTEALRVGWSILVGHRVTLGAPGVVTALPARSTWTKHDRIVLDGPVKVADGGVLRIEAGTLIEAQIGAFLLVERTGRIEAAGTLEEPIELTCATQPRFSGCWGGVIIHGNAGINAGTPTSPAGARGGPGGCLETSDPQLPGSRFGGCVDADSSGFLHYVRIEYAERGLQLRGVGSATPLREVQANRSRFDGVLAFGGAANLRHLFLTANGTGLRWTGGWRGAAQGIAVQQDPTRFGAALVGQNAASPTGDPEALPRSAPAIHNLTILAQSLPANPDHATARALVLERGTAGSLRNAFLYAPHIGLDLRDAATCAQLVGGALSLRHVLTAGPTSVGEGLVPPSCGRTEVEVLNDALDANVVLAAAGGLLVSENDLLLPDLRPVFGSALATASAEVALDGGFLETRPYRGAVPPSALPAQIPWFSGWTTPAPEPAPIPSGIIAGLVTSPFRGPLVGVGVRDAVSGAVTTTGAGGAYTLSLPSGTVLLEVTSLPAECPAPPDRAGVVLPATTSSLDLTVNCWPFPGAPRLGAGEGFMCGVADQGTHCWGRNHRGQLGNGMTTNSTLPVKVQVAFSDVSAGAAHACGRTASGVVWCWGAGDAGQLGDGTGLDRSLPVQVSGGHQFLVASAGARHTCAVKGNGSVWCWGENTFGQLGDGSTTASLTPVQVQSPIPFAAVSAGARHACALDRDGAAHCWGDGVAGQLGDGTASSRLVPVAVATQERFAAITANGVAHTCAATAGQGVWCWGTNALGQLGDGTTQQRNAPVPVAGGVALASPALGAGHSCAVAAASAAYCWGGNAVGQLGTGTTSDTWSPAAVHGSPNIFLMAAGPDFTCGTSFGAVTVDDDGNVVVTLRALLCWGSNANGEFGRGNTVSSAIPQAAAFGLTFPK